MAVKIRMMRIGRRHRPFFRINAVEGRNPQCGRIIEKLGHYDPVEKDETKQIVLNTERIKIWLEKGAVPSESVSDILRRHGIEDKQGIERRQRREKAKSIARAQGKMFNKADKAAAQKAEEAAATAVEEAAKAAEEAKKAEEAAAKAKEEEAKKAAEETAKAEEEAAKATEEEPKKAVEEDKAEAEAEKSDDAEASE
jgi:small subunit ribosomal protein S16